LNPQLLFHELSARLPDGAILLKGFARALLSRDPESARLIRQSIKGKLAEILAR
jgi:hypothetical protein